MARKRTYWPTASLLLWASKRWLDTHLDDIVKRTAIEGTAQAAALQNIHSALVTYLPTLGEYHEVA